MKRLSAADFDNAIRRMALAKHLRAITRAVLVDGKPQHEIAQQYGLTRPAISQACKRVHDVALEQQALAQGLVRVQVWLTEPEASVVQDWASKYPINHHPGVINEDSHRRNPEGRAR